MKTKNPAISALDLIFATRPMLLIPVWGFMAFGFWNAHQGQSRSLLTFHHYFTAPMVFSFLLFSLSVASVYILNQIADVSTDIQNPGLPLIASGIVKKSSAWIMAAFLGAVAIIAPFFLCQPLLSLLSLFALGTGVLYSFKPAHFSGRPVLDFLANATGYGFIAFGAGWYLGGGQLWSIHLCAAALPYFLLMCAGSISSTVPDIEGDRRTGKMTSAVRLGELNAQILAAFFLFSAAIVSFLTKDRLALTCAVSCFPVYASYFIFGGPTLTEATYKVGGLVCMTASMLLAPILFFASLFVFCMTWLYFRIRHHVSYPTLVPMNDEK